MSAVRRPWVRVGRECAPATGRRVGVSAVRRPLQGSRAAGWQAVDLLPRAASRRPQGSVRRLAAKGCTWRLAARAHECPCVGRQVRVRRNACACARAWGSASHTSHAACIWRCRARIFALSAQKGGASVTARSWLTLARTASRPNAIARRRKGGWERRRRRSRCSRGEKAHVCEGTCVCTCAGTG